MTTIAALPAVIASLGSSLSALPSSLVPNVDLSSLTASLANLSSDIGPVLPNLGQLQAEALIHNTTWLAGNLDFVEGLLDKVPRADVEGVPQEDLIALILLGTTRYDIMTVWSPECWAIVFAFMLAVFAKILTSAMLTHAAVKRVKKRIGIEHVVITHDAAKSILSKPVRATVAHAINLIVSSVVLGCQLAAWRLFVLPGTPMRFEDAQLLAAGMKLLLVNYAAELLFADVHAEIYLHHLFTFLLLLVGQICAFKTNSPKFFRLANWLILQASTEQTTYASMVCYHASTFLRIQDHDARTQRRLLHFSYWFMTITKWITWPQKFVPAAFAIYWLARMWDEIRPMLWGRVWLGFCTSILSILLVLQLKFCDDVAPLANHFRAKLWPSDHPPARQGPFIRFVLSLTGRRARTAKSFPYSGGTFLLSESDLLTMPPYPVYQYSGDMTKEDFRTSKVLISESPTTTSAISDVEYLDLPAPDYPRVHSRAETYPSRPRAVSEISSTWIGVDSPTRDSKASKAMFGPRTMSKRSDSLALAGVQE